MVNEFSFVLFLFSVLHLLISCYIGHIEMSWMQSDALCLVLPETLKDNVLSTHAGV